MGTFERGVNLQLDALHGPEYIAGIHLLRTTVPIADEVVDTQSRVQYNTMQSGNVEKPLLRLCFYHTVCQAFLALYSQYARIDGEVGNAGSTLDRS